MSEFNHEPTPAEIRKERVPTHKKVIKTLWILLGVAVLSVLLLFFGLTFTDLPDTKELENPKNEWASEVFAANGDVIGRYFTENRVPVTFGELNPHVAKALVATEDERFYEHSGIDFYALGRSGVKTLILGDKSAGGASTITQQLARLLFTGTRSKSFTQAVFQKLKEWIIAVRLERKYTKQEIMVMYLNKFDFLYDSHGIIAASETYFGKSQDSLNIEEAAMLVGMLKNPSYFNPKRYEDRVKLRREVVMSQMVRNGVLTQTEYDSLRQLPLGLDFKRKTHTSGLAQYFRMHLREYLKDVLNSDEAEKKPDGTSYDVYRDGLKVFTTIDPEMQKLAEEAMFEHMSKLQPKFNKYWTSRSKNPWTYKDEETTDQEMEARARKLEWLIRHSDRYSKLRGKYLDMKNLKALTDKFDNLKMRDIDIDRMLSEESKKGSLTSLISRGIITKKMAAAYRKAMKSDEWKAVKKDWKKLQSAVTKEFDKPVKMRVFAYNKKMETDTTMSPLDSLKYHHNFLQIGSMSVDPRTGYVKTWVGGINNKYFAYDHVTSNRQVGSTFKPFVYATAIGQMGMSPCYEVQDLPQTIMPGDGEFYLKKEWTPDNSSGKFTAEIMTLKTALRKSVNTTSVFLMKQLHSTRPVRDLVKKMGIDADKQYPNGQKRVPEVPSICLGSCDLQVIEMAGAYTAFANGGKYIEPIFVTRIEDKNGRLIFSPNQDELQALEPEPNFVMVEMLKYVAQNVSLKSEVGGKTGTTNDFKDGWFMGITPNLVVGTWVGGEDKWIRFLDISHGSGARLARPYFTKFMKKLEASDKVDYDITATFPRPRYVNIELDCGEYASPNEEEEEETEPEDEFYEDAFGESDFMDDPTPAEIPTEASNEPAAILVKDTLAPINQDGRDN
jgi:penicillin-binding protein 1A